MKKVLATFLALIMVLATFAALPTFAADAGWDGTTATKPAGSGTESDPYLIASAENFYWIQKNTPSPDNNENYGKVKDCPPAFEGIYFEQVCDIDFNGKTMKSIGSYSMDNAGTKDSAKLVNGIYIGGFGGVYNGNGYALKNLIVTSAHGNKTNHNWPTGLFASIWGATLKNMVLDNVDVVSTNPATGILVGKAMAPTVVQEVDADGETTGTWTVHEESDNFAFNVIENITIADTCSVSITLAGPEIKGTWAGTAGNVGAIAALAYGTTIRNCVNNADIAVSLGVTCIGGLVGQVGNSTLIENCINNGDFLISPLPSAITSFTSETAVGGLAGVISGNSNGSDWSIRSAATGVKIVGSVNNGLLQMQDGMKASYNAFYFGGIVGGMNTILPATNSTETYPYLIENCINTAAVNDTCWTNVTFGSGNAGRRTGGIVGSGWCSNGANAGTLYIKDSLSVDVPQSVYAGTNEFRCQTNNTAAGLQMIVPVGLNAQVLGENDTYTAYAAKANNDKTLGTFTATTDKVFELADGAYVRSETLTVQDKIDEITTAVAEAQEDGKTSVVALGYQAHNTDGTTYRIVMGLHSLRHKNVGVEATLTVDGEAATLAPDTNSKVVYTAVVGYEPDPENEGQTKAVTYTAEELGIEYLTTMTLSDVAVEGTSVYTLKTYVTGQDGNKIYGDVIVITFIDGAYSTASLNPEA